MRLEKENALNENRFNFSQREHENETSGLRTEITLCRAKLIEAQQSAKENVEQTQHIIENLKSDLAKNEGELALLKNLRAELARLQKELEFKTTESNRHSDAVCNLHRVLEQFQQDLFQLRESLNTSELRCKSLTEKLENNQEVFALQEKLKKQELDYALLVDDLKSKCTQCEQLETEVSKLRVSLIQTMKNFGGDENVVDRRIVIKLLVTFFEHNKPHEVLELMSRILQFSEDDKEKVGLNKQGNIMNRFVSYLPSFVASLPKNLYTAASTLPTADISRGNGDNLADLWVKFLLAEVKSVNDENALAAAANSLAANSSAPSDNVKSNEVGNEKIEVIPDLALPPPKLAVAANDSTSQSFSTFSLPPFKVLNNSNMQTDTKVATGYPYAYPPPMFQ